MYIEDYEDKYYGWLVDLISTSRNQNTILHNHLLLNILYNRPFRVHPSVPMDKNRMYDGLELRERFIQETGHDRYRFKSDDCSILEMLIALAIRCEETIMGNKVTNKTYKWFWTMIDNLTLYNCTDEGYIKYILDNLINRTYNKDGSNGGLFIVENPRKPMNKTEIWYQMGWYLNNTL